MHEDEVLLQPTEGNLLYRYRGITLNARKSDEFSPYIGGSYRISVGAAKSDKKPVTTGDLYVTSFIGNAKSKKYVFT